MLLDNVLPDIVLLVDSLPDVFGVTEPDTRAVVVAKERVVDVVAERLVNVLAEEPVLISEAGGTTIRVLLGMSVVIAGEVDVEEEEEIGAGDRAGLAVVGATVTVVGGAEKVVVGMGRVLELRPRVAGLVDGAVIVETPGWPPVRAKLGVEYVELPWVISML